MPLYLAPWWMVWITGIAIGILLYVTFRKKVKK